MSPCNLGGIWITCLFIAGGNTLDFRLETIPESPGLYYEYIGEARLSNSVWKILTYVDLSQVDSNFEVVKKYARFTIDFCKVHENADWVNLTECRSSIRHAERRLDKLESMRFTLTELTRREANLNRRRRSLFGFFGTISH